MKKLFFLISIIFLSSCAQKSHYEGIVVEKYRTNAGDRIPSESHIVFFSDSLKRNIDIEVTDNTYANFNVGNRIGFELYENQVK